MYCDYLFWKAFLQILVNAHRDPAKIVFYFKKKNLVLSWRA